MQMFEILYKCTEHHPSCFENLCNAFKNHDLHDGRVTAQTLQPCEIQDISSWADLQSVKPMERNEMMLSNTPHRVSRTPILLIAVIVLLCACGESAKLPAAQGFGPNPQLPAQVKTLIPTVNIERIRIPTT